jgi:hypothetical protein
MASTPGSSLTFVPFGISAPTGSTTLSLRVTTLRLAQQAGQGDAFRPGHGAHLDQLSNHAARVEARAGGQGLRRGQQGARSVEDLAGAVAHGGRQHRAGRQGEHWFRTTSTGRRVLARTLKALTGTSY